MNISPIIIVLLAVASIVVDYTKYRREPLSPLWTFAFRFFLPPLYLIYLYSVIEYRMATGIYVSIHAPNEGSDRNIWVKKYLYAQMLILLLSILPVNIAKAHFLKDIQLLKCKISCEPDLGFMFTFGSQLCNNRSLQVDAWLGSDMFDSAFPVITEVIVT